MQPADNKNDIIEYSRGAISNREIFCALKLEHSTLADFKDPKVLAFFRQEQARQAANLSFLYRNGGRNAAKDEQKAKKYAAMANFIKDADPIPLLSVENFSFLSKNFNHWRIYLIRIHLLIINLNKDSYGILPSQAKIAGLFYGPMFLVELGAILRATFNPNSSETERQLKSTDGTTTLLFRRFKNSFLKDDRPSRMFNSGFWFTVNILGLTVLTAFTVFSLPLVSLVMAGATITDMVHEAVIGLINHNRHQHFIHQIDTAIANADHKLGLATDETQMTKHKEKKHLLETLRTEVKFQAERLDRQNLIHFAKTMVILPGLLMMFFPATLIPGLIVTAIGLVISSIDNVKKLINAIDPETTNPPPKPSIETVKEARDPKDKNNKYPAAENSNVPSSTKESNISLAYKHLSLFSQPVKTKPVDPVPSVPTPVF